MKQETQDEMIRRSLKQTAKSLSLVVNGMSRTVTATADTPLLYVLRDELHLRGPRFGCGLAQCGACTVHLDGEPIRSCVTPAAAVVGHKVTTLEGLAANYKGSQVDTVTGLNLHPVQQAWIDEQVPQCGFCQNGWIMYTAHLLENTKNPTDTEIHAALDGLKCRCGTQFQIMNAVRRAAKAMG